MSIQNRRIFMLQAAAAGCAVASGSALAQGAAKVDPKDPQAVALGYVEDTAKADKAKFPKHTAEQRCNNCQLYQGKAADAQAPCGVFGGKQVAGKGWCSAWVKKAG